MTKYRKIISFIVLFVAGTISPVFSSIVPKWEIGDWWIVESQSWYDPSLIARREKQPHWTKIYSWKYVVEAIDTLSQEKYYIVSMKQIPDTGFSYGIAFRYWLRTSDLFVGRFEIENIPSNYSPQTDPPRFVHRDYSPKEAQSFNTYNYPIAPLTTPLFSSVMDTINPRKIQKMFSEEEKKRYSSHDCTYIQETKSIEMDEIAKTAHAKLKNKLAKITQQESKLVFFRDNVYDDKIRRSEKQYWISGMPWAIYGEATDNNTVVKKYWLVETGKAGK